jgi:hypothetical protein
MKDVAKIFHGLHLTVEPAKHQMVENLLTDVALTLYNAGRTVVAMRTRAQAAAAADRQTPGDGAAILQQDLAQHMPLGHTVFSLQEMMTGIMPRRVLSRAKRYLRRECRKPADMKIKNYLQHIYRINLSELVSLPPFNANQNLTEDELLDIVLFGTPKSWQKEMERQGFDPMENNLTDVIGFMEQIEASEDFDPKPSANDKSKDKSQGKAKGNRSRNTGTGRQDLYCVYHGECNHSSNDCAVLKALAAQKKAKTSHNSNDRNDRKPSGNWKSNADNQRRKSNKDLNAFVKKAVKAGVKKELSEKKRKASSDDELDLAALDEELASFNYTLDNLDINENDFTESA